MMCKKRVLLSIGCPQSGNIPLLTKLGQHDRNFLVRFNQRVFFKRRYRTKYSLNVRGHLCTSMQSLAKSVRHSFSQTCFERLRKAVRVKKRHIFLANLKRILKHSLCVREIFLVQKFNGEMLKTSNQSEFFLKIN